MAYVARRRQQRLTALNQQRTAAVRKPFRCASEGLPCNGSAREQCDDNAHTPTPRQPGCRRGQHSIRPKDKQQQPVPDGDFRDRIRMGVREPCRLEKDFEHSDTEHRERRREHDDEHDLPAVVVQAIPSRQGQALHETA